MSDSAATLCLRPAEASDTALVLRFIRELAEYEKLLDEVVATEEMIREALFGDHPTIEVTIALWQGEPAGFALYFHNFSTVLGRHGIYLEDLFVRPAFRGRGIGKALLAHLARLAVERGCGRLEWAVLDWNEPAIGFYQSIGARTVDEWTAFRLSGKALSELAAEHLA